MSNGLATWESIVIGLIMAAAVIFFFPGVKRAISESENVPKDWAGLLIPLAAVVLFVLVLIQLV